MPRIAVEVPPADVAVSLEEMKRHLRVREDFEDDDADITAYTKAAIGHIEPIQGRAFVNTGYRQSLDNFPSYADLASSPQAYPPNLYSPPRYASNVWNYSEQIKLLRGPVRKVDRISYVGADNALHDLLPDPEFDLWSAATDFEVGEQIKDSNGNLQEVAAVGEDGLTGDTVPTWATVLGDQTTDHHVSWINKGPAPAGDFILDRDNEPARIFPKPGSHWPAALFVPNAVRIHFTAGYGADSDSVPEIFKIKIKMLTAHFYGFREPVSALGLAEIPFGLKTLLWSDRILDFAPTRG